MGRRRGISRRGGREWAVRIMLALAVAGLGFVAVTRSLSDAVRKHDAARAHRLAPEDGRAGAALAAALAGPEASPADRRRGDSLARVALLADPTAVAAASTLGINAQVRDDTNAARRFFGYSEQLSRRDLQTQLWAIEDAVARGDVGDALRHHDIALRTSRSAPELLFPVLGGAISDPAVRGKLADLLAKKPIWGSGFVDYAGMQAPDAGAMMRLLVDLRRRNVPRSPQAESAVIARLLANGEAADAWSFYRTLHPGADRRRSRDPGFVADPSMATPFDWVALNDGGVSASIQRGERGGVFQFAAPTSAGGPAIRQVQVLPPGDYRLRGHSAGLKQEADTSPYWALTCSDGRELGRVTVPDSDRNGGTYGGSFRVPTGCPTQVLSLVVQASDRIGGTEGQIDRAELLASDAASRPR